MLVVMVLVVVLLVLLLPMKMMTTTTTVISLFLFRRVRYITSISTGYFVVGFAVLALQYKLRMILINENKHEYVVHVVLKYERIKSSLFLSIIFELIASY